jgi:hypothetical protein
VSAFAGFLSALLAPLSLQAPQASLPTPARLASEGSCVAIARTALALLPFASPMLLQPAAAGATGPYGSHAYWELEIDSNNGHATLTGFTEFKFYDGTGTQIATTGGTAFSAGSGTDQSGAGVANLFDGSTGTTWNRNSATNTKCGYQFASPQAVGSIDLYCGTTMSVAPVKCRLRYSDDGVTYTTAFEIWEPSWPPSGTATRTWPQDTATKWKALRWHITANNGDRFYIMNEAEMHATVGGADICNNGAAFCSNNAGTGTTPDLLFDNSTSTHMDFDSASGQIPGDVGYYFPTTVAKPAEYSLIENNATTRGWKDWIFQGSNDGVTWTNLDTRTTVTWATLPQTQTFAVP